MITAAVAAVTLSAQQAPNYELAERFSAKKVSQMVHSTKVEPNWFMKSDRFWYKWTDSKGTRYYVVDARTGKKSEIFDMAALAMQITGIVRDPFDAQHLPIENLKLKDDKVFTFGIKSSVDETDSLRIKRWGKKKVYTFSYDMASGELTDITGKETPEKYPSWVNVSPDGKIGIFARNANLFWMDEENMAKAALDDKDSTLVEHAVTTVHGNSAGVPTTTTAGHGRIPRSVICRMAWCGLRIPDISPQSNSI